MGELLPILSPEGVTIFVEEFLILASPNTDINDLIEDPRIARMCARGELSVTRIEKATTSQFLAQLKDHGHAGRLHQLFDAWLADGPIGSSD